MITNDRQYKITKTQVAKFQQAVDQFDEESNEFKNVHPKLIHAQKLALENQLKALNASVKEYEDLKEGRLLVTTVSNLSELPVALIQSRIANGLTQAELARKLGMVEQQIQRYESDKYDSASLKTLIKIADVLGITINADIQLKEIPAAEDFFNVKNYPFKQMLQRHWFSDFTGTLNEAMNNSRKMLQDFFISAGISQPEIVLTKRSIREDSSFNEFALQAWHARVINKARQQAIDKFYDKSLITENWLSSLTKLSLEDNGPKKAFEFVKEAGIRIVIEQHLEGTYLDGAAILLDSIYPVIVLTLRYDRLDNFWFVLLHEIGHILLHLSLENEAFFDDLDSTTIDVLEKEADQFALNAMIPDDIWKKSLARFSPSIKTIISQAKISNVDPALVAGRIRRETGKYHLFNELIGLGEVRKQFANELKN
jgi:HTH-type transcriptional regulator / antitoxin HigA